MTASHHDLDLDLLEQLTRDTHTLGKSIVAASTRTRGCVVLSTCNRFEVYLDVDLDASAPETALVSTARVAAPVTAASSIAAATATATQLISQASSLPHSLTQRAFTVHTGPDVAAHLFRVASGLDSLVVGEREIAGQVRRALRTAHVDQLTTGPLERLFQRALRTSKAIASDTALSSDGRSVVSVALDLASQAAPPWPHASVLVVGTGAYAGATVAALRARGVRDIAVYSGSGRAHAFAGSHQITPTSDLPSAIADADVVVACSGNSSGHRGGTPPSPSPTSPILDDPAHHPAHDRAGEVAKQSSISYVLDVAAIAAARRGSAEAADGPEGAARPLVVVDLALHRDADPRIAGMAGVGFIDLATVRANAPAAAEEVLREAEAVLAAGLAEYAEREDLRAADAAVTAVVEEFARKREARVVGLVGRGVDRAEAGRCAARELNAEMHRRIGLVRARG